MSHLPTGGHTKTDNEVPRGWFMVSQKALNHVGPFEFIAEFAVIISCSNTWE